ncbi:MAG: cupin domain-containing protein [Candidatus Bathyarchaeia archaeon]|jgi:quercetin dioxygenase-like cupin family protein
MGIKVFDSNKDYVKIRHVQGSFAKLVVWPGVGSKNCCFIVTTAKSGQSSIVHTHEGSEDVFMITKGKATVVDVDSGREYKVKEGDVVFVEPGTNHMVKYEDEYVSVGCIAPPDPKQLERIISETTSTSKKRSCQHLTQKRLFLSGRTLTDKN